MFSVARNCVSIELQKLADSFAGCVYIAILFFLSVAEAVLLKVTSLSVLVSTRCCLRTFIKFFSRVSLTVWQKI